MLVDPTLGTGAVKVTPAHDPNDFECGIRHSLQQVSVSYCFLALCRSCIRLSAQVNVLTDDGRMNSEGGPFEGQSRFQARASIREFLTQKGLYAGKAPNPMSLNICSRSGDVLEPLLKPQVPN